mmetsp:Transcript_3517/g.12613  ORF Transcript_3517/g.12613 Transcript_3517/m.12613 type:complete len:532 (-) Transcript_3517:84-1679(-)
MRVQGVSSARSSTPAVGRRGGCFRSSHRAHTVVAARGPAPPRARKAGEDTASLVDVEWIANVKAAAETAFATLPSLASSSASADAPAAAEQAALTSKVREATQVLEANLVERETEVRLMLLAALCGEHLLLLGPPGTAKSLLARRLSSLTGGSYFERLLTRFSVPEELFGPLSLAGLERGVYVREVEGYLPTAEVAFVDEIFKANSAILNALLTLLNERLFDNGSAREKVPLLCLVGASNEMPESEELDALYDRFLLRRHVRQLTPAGLRSFSTLAMNGSTLGEFVPSSNPLTLEEFAACRDKAVASVRVPDSVIDLLCDLREFLQDKCEPPVYVSDRRFGRCITFLQVAAYASGADEVSEYDCLLLEHVLGNRQGDEEKVAQYVLESISADPGLMKAELSFLGSFGRACMTVAEEATDGAKRAENLEELRAETAALVDALSKRRVALKATLDGEFPSMRASAWFSATAIASASQVLAPAMQENLTKVEMLLQEVLLLAEALKTESDAKPGLLEKLMPRRAKQYAKGVATP